MAKSKTRCSCVFFSALFLTTLLIPGDVQAAKMPKVDLCHYQAEEDSYKLISISGNAQQAHIAHGDLIPGGAELDENCNPRPPVTVLARAWINRDLLPGYDETVDIEIARFEDTDFSGGATVGDTIITSEYPINFDAANPVTLKFNSSPVQITDINNAGDFGFALKVGTTTYTFLNGEASERFTGSVNYSENSFPSGGNASFFGRSYSTNGTIRVNPSSPSSPSGPSLNISCPFEGVACNGDWLKVEIFGF